MNDASHHGPSKSSGEVGEDPKREYFEKMGAQFASGFFAGTEVGELDEIDLYNCLHREPEAVHFFYRADEALKESWIKKDSHEAVKALDEMIRFVVEMVIEDYPRTHYEVCREFKDRHLEWHDLGEIMKEEKEPETTL